MPQTLGAFLAIMAVMTFALNYHRSTLQSQRSMINSEMEVMASAVATDVMNYVASKPFDAPPRTTPGYGRKDRANVSATAPLGRNDQSKRPLTADLPGLEQFITH